MSGGNILGGEYTRVERSGGIFRGGVYLEPSGLPLGVLYARRASVSTHQFSLADKSPFSLSEHFRPKRDELKVWSQLLMFFFVKPL